MNLNMIEKNKKNKEMRKYILITMILTCLLHCFSCSSDPVTPPDDNLPDTTSHNFTFQTWEFGNHSSSILYDVAIINDTSIWAVGEIYLNDSTGLADPTPYNGLYWDGKNWNVIKIPTKTYSGTIVSSSISTIFCFSKNDIWTFSNAGSYSHWDGSHWITEFVAERIGGGNRLWGSSSTDLYLVCNQGGISFYNGKTWQLIESGTDLSIYDIWGQKTNTGEYEILCVAAAQSISSDKKIFRLLNQKVQNLPYSGIPTSIRSIWFKPDKKYYVAGSGIFTKADINTNQTWEPIWEGVTQFYTNSIDGNDLNDIVACGAYGELLHWNGASWKSFQSKLQMEAGSYRTIKIKDNLVIAVGYDSPKAVITIGKR